MLCSAGAGFATTEDAGPFTLTLEISTLTDFGDFVTIALPRVLPVGGVIGILPVGGVTGAGVVSALLVTTGPGVDGALAVMETLADGTVDFVVETGTEVVLGRVDVVLLCCLFTVLVPCEVLPASLAVDLLLLVLGDAVTVVFRACKSNWATSELFSDTVGTPDVL